MDLLTTFKEFQLIFVPRKSNIMAHSLAFAARICLTPYETKKCTTQIKFRPAIPNNEEYWQVFDGHKQIEEFLQPINEFELPSSDSDYEYDCPSEENLLDEEEKSSRIVDVNLMSSKL